MMSVKSMNNCILVTARCRPPCRDRVHLVIQNPCVTPHFDIVDSGLGQVMYWDEATNQPTTEVTNMVLVYTGLSAKLKLRNYDPTTRYWLTSSRGFYNTSDFFYDDGHFDFTLFPALIDIPVILTMKANHNSCLHRLAVKAYDYDVSIFEYTTQDGKFHRDVTRGSVDRRYWFRSDIVSMKIVRLASHVTSLAITFSQCRNMVSFECDFNVTSNITSMFATWQDCNPLTSFPRIDTSRVTDMGGAWHTCHSLTSFPQIDTSRVTNMRGTWGCCSSLTSFPQIDTRNVCNMWATWSGCSSLTSFPRIDTSRVKNMVGTWNRCNNLPLGQCNPCIYGSTKCYYLDNTGGKMPDRRGLWVDC